jgi:hypothetical protein
VGSDWLYPWPQIEVFERESASSGGGE